MRITARKQPSESGLASVAQAPRGYIIKLDGVDVGWVSASRDLFTRGADHIRWYWYAGVGEHRSNTASESVFYKTKEDALDACMSWVKERAREREEQKKQVTP